VIPFTALFLDEIIDKCLGSQYWVYL